MNRHLNFIRLCDDLRLIRLLRTRLVLRELYLDELNTYLTEIRLLLQLVNRKGDFNTKPKQLVTDPPKIRSCPDVVFQIPRWRRNAILMGSEKQRHRRNTFSSLKSFLVSGSLKNDV